MPGWNYLESINKCEKREGNYRQSPVALHLWDSSKRSGSSNGNWVDTVSGEGQTQENAAYKKSGEEIVSRIRASSAVLNANESRNVRTEGQKDLHSSHEFI